MNTRRIHTRKRGFPLSLSKFAYILAPIALLVLASCEASNPVASTEPTNAGNLPICQIDTGSGRIVSNIFRAKISIHCPTDSAKIGYTINGTDPTYWHVNWYVDSVHMAGLPYLTNWVVIKARAWAGNDSSPWVQAIFMDSLNSPISIHRGAALYKNTLQIGLNSLADLDWDFLYTLNGQTPSDIPDATTFKYSTPFVITGQTTITVKAVRDGFVYPITFRKTYTPTPAYSGPFGTLTDTRDGQSYRTVRIGNHTWMAENLRYRSSKSQGTFCYGDDTSLCQADGALYDWASAMDIDTAYLHNHWGGSDTSHQGICPLGWHIPSDHEWTDLQASVDSLSALSKGNADLALLSDTGWENNRTWARDSYVGAVMVYSYTPGDWTYNGVDLVGFSVRPAGLRDANKNYAVRSYYAGFWTSSESDGYYKGMSWARNFYGGFRGIFRDVGNSRLEALSVRCLQD